MTCNALEPTGTLFVKNGGEQFWIMLPYLEDEFLLSIGDQAELFKDIVSMPKTVTIPHGQLALVLRPSENCFYLDHMPLTILPTIPRPKTREALTRTQEAARLIGERFIAARSSGLKPFICDPNDVIGAIPWHMTDEGLEGVTLAISNWLSAASESE